MRKPLVGGQQVTREAVCAAYAGAALRERGAVKVYVVCAACGAVTTTWLRASDEVVPVVWCWRCEEEL